MKKHLLKTFSIVTTVVLLTTTFSGCGKQSSEAQQQKSSAPVKFSIMMDDSGRVLKEDDPVIKEVEKKTNTKLDVSLVAPSEFSNKLNVMVSSGSLPDMVRINGYNASQYIPQGVFLDLTSYIDKYGSNIKKAIPKEAWESTKYNGKIYSIPTVNYTGKYNFFVRQDWLDNLGLKAPTTIDELTDMLTKFTFNDPDKDGKNDTFGYSQESEINADGSNFRAAFAALFGPFGVMPGMTQLKDGKLYYGSITPEYKDAVEYIAKLYKQKLIDPDIFITKTDQAKQKLVQSKSGSFTGWWSTGSQVLMDQMKMNQVNPKAKWSVISPIKGKSGESGMPSNGLVAGTINVSSKCKNPEEVVKFIDYLLSDEGAWLTHAGIKGVHYTEKDGKFEKRTPEGEKAMNEKWLDVLSQFAPRIDIAMEGIYKVNNPTYWPYIQVARDAKQYKDVFEGITTSESQTYKADLQKLEVDWFTKFVTGKEPISKFDDYVKQWKDKGGKQMIDSFIKEYNKRHGTNYTAGN